MQLIEVHLHTHPTEEDWIELRTGIVSLHLTVPEAEHLGLDLDAALAESEGSSKD